MCFMKLYISLLYYLAYLGLCLPFFFLMKSKRGRRVCVLLKISGYEEVMDCKRKGEIYYILFHGWTKFSRDFVIIKKGEIVEVSSALTPWPGCFDDYKVQWQKEERN